MPRPGCWPCDSASPLTFVRYDSSTYGWEVLAQDRYESHAVWRKYGPLSLSGWTLDEYPPYHPEHPAIREEPDYELDPVGAAIRLNAQQQMDIEVEAEDMNAIVDVVRSQDLVRHRIENSPAFVEDDPALLEEVRSGLDQGQQPPTYAEMMARRASEQSAYREFLLWLGRCSSRFERKELPPEPQPFEPKGVFRVHGQPIPIDGNPEELARKLGDGGGHWTSTMPRMPAPDADKIKGPGLLWTAAGCVAGALIWDGVAGLFIVAAVVLAALGAAFSVRAVKESALRRERWLETLTEMAQAHNDKLIADRELMEGNARYNAEKRAVWVEEVLRPYEDLVYAISGRNRRAAIAAGESIIQEVSDLAPTIDPKAELGGDRCRRCGKRLKAGGFPWDFGPDAPMLYIGPRCTAEMMNSLW